LPTMPNLSNDPHFTIPSGESQQSFCSRSLQCLEDLANQHLGEDVLVITHGGVIGCLLRYTLGIPLRQVKHFRVDNAAIAHFTYSPESAWFMECWGDIRHLDERGFC
ncbi:histidine phosphatase family protein, partial [Candidatus Venteria ishoeyi]